jgi:hypothetical protein
MKTSRLACTSLLAVSLLAACDTGETPDPPDEVTFEGVTYAAIGQAELEETDAGLVVSNIGNSGADGVRVNLASGIAEADFRAAPVGIPAGGRWGMQVFGDLDGTRTALATVWNEAVSGTRHEIQFDFAPELEVETVTIDYFLSGVLQLSVPRVPLLGDGAQRVLAASAGQSDDEPESVHYVRDGPRIVVSTDYGGGSPKRGSAAGECPTGGTPVFLQFAGLPPVVCTDFVRVTPETETQFPSATSLEISARTLPAFTLTGGSLE